MAVNFKILVVDDEEDILEFLKYNLEKEGYIVATATDGKEAIETAERFGPHLIILDIMMPGMDGIEVCETLRQKPQFQNTLIAFLTARGESFTQISALETGGDDFIQKPIKPSVLMSRVKAILRRHADVREESHHPQSQQSNLGHLEINHENYTVMVEGKELPLARKEFELLVFLASKPGKVFKRGEILQKVWGNSVIVGDRTIDVHIRKLREKIGEQHINTLKGVGYKFDY